MKHGMRRGRFTGRRCGKRRHASEGKAAAHARSLIVKGDPQGDRLNTYWCGDCRAWHVGHKAVK